MIWWYFIFWSILFVSTYLIQFEVTTSFSHFRSEEWNYIPDDQKEEMGLTFDHDGEFWCVFLKILNFSHFNVLIIVLYLQEKYNEIKSFGLNAMSHVGWLSRISTRTSRGWKSATWVQIPWSLSRKRTGGSVSWWREPGRETSTPEAAGTIQVKNLHSL